MPKLFVAMTATYVTLMLVTIGFLAVLFYQSTLGFAIAGSFTLIGSAIIFIAIYATLTSNKL